MTERTTMLCPTLRYRDAMAAIAWLERAFGFSRGLVVPGPDGAVAHAELHLGAGVVMIGSARDDAFGMRLPSEAGGTTHGIYVALADKAAVDAHHSRAATAGAEIVRALMDTDYGSRDYSARDPEGYLWHFGSYWPERPADL